MKTASAPGSLSGAPAWLADAPFDLLCSRGIAGRLLDVATSQELSIAIRGDFAEFRSIEEHLAHEVQPHGDGQQRSHHPGDTDPPEIGTIERQQLGRDNPCRGAQRGREPNVAPPKVHWRKE